MKVKKFLAWDGQKMVSPDYIDRDGVAWWKEGTTLRRSETVLEFTGKRDIRNKEVYEGDMVKGFGDFISSFAGVITWDHYQWFVINKGRGIPLSSFDFIDRIGNIYENPELGK